MWPRCPGRLGMGSDGQARRCEKRTGNSEKDIPPSCGSLGALAVTRYGRRHTEQLPFQRSLGGKEGCGHLEGLQAQNWSGHLVVGQRPSWWGCPPSLIPLLCQMLQRSVTAGTALGMSQTALVTFILDFMRQEAMMRQKPPDGFWLARWMRAAPEILHHERSLGKVELCPSPPVRASPHRHVSPPSPC